MDKNAIRKFAVWARENLIERVSERANYFGVNETEILPADGGRVRGMLLTQAQQRQRDLLIRLIQQKGYRNVMEEAAYTWFNRLIALRFMEVNSYLPSRIRVFTDENGAFQPQILSEAIHLDMDGLDMDKVFAMKEANQNEELFRYLLIVQCNALSEVLPGMFQPLEDYTELLLPDNLLREGSVIEQMIALIPEDDWTDQVQIIGWLYQYYNSAPKDQVFADLKKNIKITKEKIPAATQLFTPDWIVRYMVENSLGRLWLEGHPDENLRAGWKYYLDEAEQEPAVAAQLAEIRHAYAAMQPEDIRVIDPCMGSGHILAYMFDVLVQIYESYGYTTREAVQSIVENNLYGLDIDDRAAQLAYFAVMMKARQYDRRFLTRGIKPHVYAIAESNGVDRAAIDLMGAGLSPIERNNAKNQLTALLDAMHDAKEYGSILTIEEYDWALLRRFVQPEQDATGTMGDLYSGDPVLLQLIDVGEALAQKYDAVVTNPPYMGNGNMNCRLSRYVQYYYPDEKTDLYTTFISRITKMVKQQGFQAMVTMQSWMNLGAFESLRKKLCKTVDIITLWHLDDMLLGIAYETSAFVFRKSRVNGIIGAYYEATKEIYARNEDDMSNALNQAVFADQDTYLELIGCPIAYALGRKCTQAYVKSDKLSSELVTREGMTTGDNDKFLRLWYEVAASKRGHMWFPYCKGGEFRKWYGNNEYYVNWMNDGKAVKENIDAITGRIRSHNYNGEYAFVEGITWSAFSSRGASFRYSTNDSLFDSKGSKGFCKKGKLRYVLGFLNSVVGMKYLDYFSGAKDTKPGHLLALPYRTSDSYSETVDELVETCILHSCTDWDSFETSWDFQRHPLIRETATLAEAFAAWQAECDARFTQLKANEEELNRIFIDIYGLQDELTPDVADKDVTVRRADLGRDVRSFISYAVGCMFGRYSPCVPGLLYAGGEWDYDNIKKRIWDGFGKEFTPTDAVGDFDPLIPDKDGILPICDDEYFEDDIVGKFVKFVEVVYGRDTLDENLRFIADALGGKGTPREVIRSYFLNDFYADHLKIYQKRPIYWLFDSGKKGGFKCLIYMHRYRPDTIARIRTDYVHEQQARYRTAIADLQKRVDAAGGSERVHLSKQLAKLQAQADEIHAYEEKVHHLADQMIAIDLDDGVKVNYAKFADVLAKIK